MQQFKLKEKAVTKIKNQASFRCCRQTQTITSKSKFTSTGCESGTQTGSQELDKVLPAKAYISSSFVFERKHNKSRVLQRYWRTHVARFTLKKLKLQSLLLQVRFKSTVFKKFEILTA
mmetsp:Transcript_24275/g.34792  ORF Transcript_24275/g.34792 Transcript_24275/m.34792 type:complete len:118 (+) Transcript_24275:901-1254(+)